MMLALVGLWVIRGDALLCVIRGTADADDAGFVGLVGDSSDG